MKKITASQIFAVALVLVSPALLSASPLFSVGDSVHVFFDGTVNSSYQNNVFLEPDNEDDFIFILSPGLSIEAGRNSNASFNIVFREDVIRYSSFEELDEENFNVITNGMYQNEKLDLKADASFQQVSTNAPSRGVTANGIIVNRDLYHVGFEAEYDFSPKTYVEFGSDYRAETFTDNPGQFRDQDNFSVPLNVLYRYSEKLSVGLGYRFKTTDVDQSPLGSIGNGYEDHFGSLALRYKAVKWNARVNLGIQDRSTDIGDDKSSFTVNSDFDYKLTPKTLLTAGFDRDFDSGGAGRSIEDTKFTLGGTWNYNELFTVGAGVGYTFSDFSSTVGQSGQEDDRYTSTVNVAYSPRTFLTFGAGYSFDYNESTAPDDEYESHSFNLSARLRY